MLFTIWLNSQNIMELTFLLFFDLEEIFSILIGCLFSLQSSLESLEKKNSELEFELIKGQKDRKDTLEKLHEVEQKCLQFQQNLQRYCFAC